MGVARSAAQARQGLITYIEMFHIHSQKQCIGQWESLETLHSFHRRDMAQHSTVLCHVPSVKYVQSEI